MASDIQEEEYGTELPDVLVSHTTLFVGGCVTVAIEEIEAAEPMPPQKIDLSDSGRIVDWTASMQQSFEYYVVDPGTWKDKRLIATVKSCSINWDSTAETLGSASFEVAEPLGECYIRAYIVAIQNGVKDKRPIGTFLVQTPSIKFDGKITSVSLDAYTPLIELKETLPPLGYTVPKETNIMEMVYRLAREHTRTPVTAAMNETRLYYDFVANTNDTWLTFLSDLAANAKHSFSLDDLGQLLFTPEQETASLQPVWTYDDDNSSILYSDLTLDRDLYGIPNVVEVVYSKGSGHYYGRAVNDDPESPVSTVSRGREIVHRETDPDIGGTPTKGEIQQYAERLLKNLSSLEYTVSYSHGYCPVRLGDCVRLNYKRAGLNGIKAKVISQSIKCEPGCQVMEKAVFTKTGEDIIAGMAKISAIVPTYAKRFAAEASTDMIFGGCVTVAVEMRQVDSLSFGVSANLDISTDLLVAGGIAVAIDVREG